MKRKHVKNTKSVQSKKVDRAHTLGIFVALVLLITITSWLAWSRIFLSAERLVNQLFYSVPDSLDMIVLNITHLGSLAMLYSAALTAYILDYKKLCVKLLVAGLGAYVAAGFLKEIIMRPRPFDLWSEITAREYGRLGFGFPSGHTALIVAVAVIFWSYAKHEQRVVLVVTAVLVAISRMILGVHMPLDLVGGLWIGLLVGTGVNYLFDNFRSRQN